MEKTDGRRTTIEFDVLRTEDREFVKQQSEPFRTWMSADGTFTIEARYLSSTKTIIVLERQCGETLRVVLADISQTVREYVAQCQEKK